MTAPTTRETADQVPGPDDVTAPSSKGFLSAQGEAAWDKPPHQTADHAELKRIAYNERRRLDDPKNRKISEALRIRSRNAATAVSDPTERFLQYVEQDPNGGCWLWSGAMSGNGYGVFTLKGKNVPAHRYSVRTFIGEIGDNHVLHACDVRLCVNPGHLSLGSMSDNMQDAARKGRMWRSNKRFERIPDDLMAEAVRRVQSGESKRGVARSLNIPDASIRRAMKGVPHV